MAEIIQRLRRNDPDVNKHNTKSKGYFTPHGHCAGRKLSPTYNSWKSMVERTTNPNAVNWERYGGRGIDLCEEWRDFKNFLASMGERPAGTTLERKDNTLGYSPSNCVWKSPERQANNRRSNHRLTAFGRTLSIADWARELQINASTLTSRIHQLRWPPERALSIKARSLNKEKSK